MLTQAIARLLVDNSNVREGIAVGAAWTFVEFWQESACHTFSRFSGNSILVVSQGINF